MIFILRNTSSSNLLYITLEVRLIRRQTQPEAFSTFTLFFINFYITNNLFWTTHNAQSL